MTSQSATECTICLETKSVGEFQQAPLCAHAFCMPCYSKWTSSHATCPLCRGPIANLETTFMPLGPREHQTRVQLIRNLTARSPDIGRMIGMEYLKFLIGTRYTLPIIPTTNPL
jgi:hypothetical protein